MRYVRLSVHELVDFLLRKGSIDNRIYNQETMNEGSRIHLRYQSIQAGNYESEVALSCEIEYEDYLFTLEGRADGIIHQDNLVIIDEIKSTVEDLEEFYSIQGPWHLGQALCYAYMYASIHHLEKIGVRLTYISQQDNSNKLIKDFVYDFDLVKRKVYELIKDYSSFYDQLVKHIDDRDASALNLGFPFDEFRPGQKEVSKYVYKVCKDGGLFFFEAPTGIGKTISTLYPAVKTFSETMNEKIFYLSAKTQAKIVAHNAMELLVKNGLKTNSIVLSSKESMCQCDLVKCNPDECPFAKDYYEKINPAIRKILSNEPCINKETILKYALEETICPFEYQLDISSYCDVIICDYNYLFDPVAKLERFFLQGKVPYFALIDEAHNLSERTKDMYTVSINKEKLVLLRKSLAKTRLVSIKKSLKKLINFIDEFTLDFEEYTTFELGFPKIFYDYIAATYENMQKILKDHNNVVNDIFLDVFKMITRFNKINDYLDNTFVIYVEKKNDIKFFIRCIDSSDKIKDSLSIIRGSVMFSATLTPLDYYIKLLGGNDKTPFLRLPSPFKKENLCLLVRGDISTKYRDREKSYSEIARTIKETIKGKIGNYLVFFSSYQYLKEVLNVYEIDGENVLVQSSSMTISERDNFINEFKENPQYTTVGFAVLGGAFSEGIDLVSSRLIGAIIVGVGLPMISFERDLIKDYYNKIELDGYDYAYVNPGKNKVMQAAGRVIRSSNDRGVVVLIDSRFKNMSYRDLFKGQFASPIFINNLDSIRQYLTNFWGGLENE